ncbi:hypothetical protein DMN91_004374 [Ooceraea biroi]|uniref:Uncharacterized protein n=1 Tax=Ooceraea biroi TaxID=2015173 RepID=A0A026W6B9_OOCBI|nr:uncharacterized protein LOC105283564 isoform X1 [Ooceraea biroi]EZA50589.1 hypothetical protein X777_10940 [Ooceraea biroi]RLU24164.1 hypothetical protein DMN91_004374 [Ooceraea biroi]
MLRILIFLSCICLYLSLSSARPAEEPTRFILSNVQNDAENALPSRLEQAQQLPDGAQSDLENPISKSNSPNQSRRSLTSVQTTMPTVLFSPSTQETVHLVNENEQGILERRKPDNIRQFLDGLLRPTPIVDGIKEEQKYGNKGDGFSGIGRAFINGYENLSNFLNVLVDLPMNAARQASKGITQALNELGARIVGLQ